MAKILEEAPRLPPSPQEAPADRAGLHEFECARARVCKQECMHSGLHMHADV